MLKITIPGGELYDEKNECFYIVNKTTLTFEHSLVSISKWESKYHKPFLSKESKTEEEIMDYINFMCLTQNVDPLVFRFLSTKDYEDINKYIGDSMTATIVPDNGKTNREPITSELLYYYMTALQIPFECQKWHINRLITLIKLCNFKNNPEKSKMSSSEIMARNKALNQMRRAKLHSKG